MTTRGGLGFQFLVSVLLPLAYTGFAAYTRPPADDYHINCGSPTNSTFQGTIFDPDHSLPSGASWSLSAPGSIPAAKTTHASDSSVHGTPYQTARIFPNLSYYTFPIKKRGRHFIRLYFLPFVYRSFDLTQARFSVTTQDFTLFIGFQQTAGLLKGSEVIKEYSVNVDADQLVLSFLPTGNSFAFVNAVEVVSVPDNLILDAAHAIDPIGEYHGLSKMALESMFRINMGGPKISPYNDTLGRTWVTDDDFVAGKSLSRSVTYSGRIKYVTGGATEETAPPSVYRTCVTMAQSNVAGGIFNVSWAFPLDAGYTYLVRFHFCNIVTTALHQLSFNVYIDDSYAARDFDAGEKSTIALAAAYFLDFAVQVKDGSGELRVGIGPATTSSLKGRVEARAIMNGLEIMKLNNSVGSLAGERILAPASQNGRKTGISAVVLGVVIGAVLLCLSVVVVFLAVRRKKKKKKKKKNPSKKEEPSSTPVFMFRWSSHSKGSTRTFGGHSSGQSTNQGVSFPFSVLQQATNDFDESAVIGIGGFGKVYKGVLKDDTKVAVKRANPKSQQGVNEFRTEIQLLSRLRHRHLVSLIGYCDEGTEMILVYEYMEKGTLKSHLYGKNTSNLGWKQRVEICIGAARGLHYLHTGQAKAIIHRDVKSANILLDGNLMAKVADFGLSKTGPDLDQTHVSTAVKGSFGYLDPEYFRRQQLTEKSDVYSFGVVLLEVLCARPVIDPTLSREKINLAEWAMKWQKKGQLDKIMDPRLAGTIRPESLRKYGETAEKCLADYGADRPSMGDVLWNLEHTLQLQEPIGSTDEDAEGDTIQTSESFSWFNIS